MIIMNKKTLKWLGALAFTMMCALAVTACGGGGGDDGDDNGPVNNGGGGGDNGGGGSGGVTPSTSSIVGTWWFYFSSNDSSRGVVYNLLTFNKDYTGELVEEVGYGSDRAEAFTWKQSGNTISVTLVSEPETFTVEIVEIIDNSTMVVYTGVNKRRGYYAAYKMSGGNLSSRDIQGTWQTYKVRLWGNDNGAKYDETLNVSPADVSTSGVECNRYVFSDDASYRKLTYYNGDWLPHGPYLYAINRGRIFLLDRYETGSPYISSEVTKSSADEMIITEFYYGSTGYVFAQWRLRRAESSEDSGVDLGLDDYDNDTNLNNK